MSIHRKLPDRERVFVHSLMYHGYRFVHRRHNLKKKKGYVISSTKREDSAGIDLWVKIPGALVLIPIQITQRGVRLFRKYHRLSAEKFQDFVAHSEKRVAKKRRICKQNKIAFVLVRDYDGQHTNRTLAWGDIKALRYAVQRYTW